VAGLDPLLNAIARDALLVTQMAQQHAIDAHAVITAVEIDRPPVRHNLTVYWHFSAS
jgi:hypothetical protein